MCQTCAVTFEQALALLSSVAIAYHFPRARTVYARLRRKACLLKGVRKGFFKS